MKIRGHNPVNVRKNAVHGVVRLIFLLYLVAENETKAEMWKFIRDACLEDYIVKFVGSMADAASAGLSNRVARTVRRHALWGAIVMGMPLWVLSSVLFVVGLWHMYYSLCRYALVPFWRNFWKSSAGAFVVTWGACSLMDLVLEWLPIGGWFISGIVGYFAVVISACSYLEVLALLHKGATGERFRSRGVVHYLKSLRVVRTSVANWRRVSGRGSGLGSDRRKS